MAAAIQQRAELQRRIWQIANDVRGSVDGWDFKQYVLGSLFYRFISENFANYIEGGDKSVNYAGLSDDIITPEIKTDAIKTKGYFIYPSQLFKNVVATANTNPNLNTDLKTFLQLSKTPLLATLPNRISKAYLLILIPPATAWAIPLPIKTARLAAY